MPHASHEEHPARPAKRREGITRKLIASFKDLISNGVLVPGCKLPPERELAVKFGVNRASLRQVLKVLEIMGVISQRVGDGTYLNTSACAILDEPIDFLILLDDVSQHELFEFRLLMEPEIAARAAERGTADDLTALQSAIVRLENSRNKKARLEADVAFHEALCRAAGNRICDRLFQVINRAVFSSMDRLSVRVEIDHPLAHHKAIYQAVYERDPAEARRRMLEHLIDAKALLASTPRRAETVAVDRIPAVSRL